MIWACNWEARYIYVYYMQQSSSITPPSPALLQAPARPEWLGGERIQWPWYFLQHTQQLFLWDCTSVRLWNAVYEWRTDIWSRCQLTPSAFTTLSCRTASDDESGYIRYSRLAIPQHCSIGFSSQWNFGRSKTWNPRSLQCISRSTVGLRS